MAPTHTKKRTPIRARARPSATAATAPALPTSNPPLPTKGPKVLKRSAKHTSILNKVRTSANARISKPVPKTRRAGKRIVAAESFADMADALPAGDVDEAEDGWEGFSEDEDTVGDVPAGLRKASRSRRRKAASGEGGGKMVMTSLKHKPGAMKKKHKLEVGERERFGQNLARMVGSIGAGEGGGEQGGSAASQKERWEALRKFIGGSRIESDGFGAR